MSQTHHSTLPRGRDILFLALGVVGIGTSGPVISLSTMPVPTLIMWRNFGGALVMFPFALRKKEWRSTSGRKAIRLSAISGVLLALHFLGFFLAMRLTTVAAGTAITATQPIFTAIYLRYRGEEIARRAWGGMFIAFLSVLLITGVDLRISARSFLGDLCALAGAALAAAYMLIGAKAQKELSTSTYTSVCYSICALTALPIAMMVNFHIFAYSARQWLLCLALIAGAQILGHTMFNLSLKRVSPAVVSLIVFFEVPVSAVLAYWWQGQQPPAGTIPGIFGLLLGCTVFVLRSGKKSSSDGATK